MIKITPKRIILSAVVAVLIAVAVVANVFAGLYWDYLMTTFGKSTGGYTESVDKAAALGDDLVQEIGEESMVLLKNENNVLPLAETNRKINLFGFAATKNGFIYSGGGSSGTMLTSDKVTERMLNETVVSPAEAFRREGFEVNEELLKIYTDFSDYNATTSGWAITTVYQPPVSVYTRSVLRQAIDFSDTAVIFIARSGSESIDLPLTQNKNNGKAATDSSRTFLQLTTEEEDLIEIVKYNFAKVIVVINAGSRMELGFLDDKDIDAAVYAGLPGQSGALAIPRLMKGYKTIKGEDGTDKKVAVTPSGRLADTYTYSSRDYNPTDANMFAEPHYYTGYGQITYAENIYVGYKWYETADEEGFFKDVDNDYGKGYNGVVQYPFGYGLSYGTDFKYSITTSLPEGSEIKADTKIEIKVKVVNSASATATGKTVVQLYFTPPYYKGEIEKSSVNLLAFAKTEPLSPGVSQELTFTVTAYDLACYDDYGRNPGSHTGYELDRGNYIITLRSDAHTPIICENGELNYTVSQTINIDKDPVTGATVENRFTGEKAYMGMPIDGSTAGGETIKYLSRADFKGTFYKTRTPDRTNTDAIKEVNTKRNNRYDTDTYPVTNEKNEMYLVVKEDGSKASLSELQGKGNAKLKYNEELVCELGKNYNSEKWEKLLNQLTIDEMNRVVSNGFFKTEAIESVGKPQRSDMDGPAGFHTSNAEEERALKWVAFPVESLIGCSWNQEIAYNMGQAQGVVANATNVSGWYGPGLNLHRNPFSGRYFEYYSEDSLLVGKLAAEVIRGATNNGLYCYMKHFAVSEEGINPDNVKTWITEQALRETYLRPFEIAVKEGGANAIMTAFNCIGAVWSGACDPMNNDILRGEWGFNGALISDWALGNRSWMNGMLALRGGNDFLLDSNEPFENNATTVTLARRATKNIIYTFANTYARAKDYKENGGSDDKYRVDLRMEVTASPFSPLPIIMVAGIWILALAGSAVCVTFIVKDVKKKNNA